MRRKSSIRPYVYNIHETTLGLLALSVIHQITQFLLTALKAGAIVFTEAYPFFDIVHSLLLETHEVKKNAVAIFAQFFGASSENAVQLLLLGAIKGTNIFHNLFSFLKLCIAHSYVCEPYVKNILTRVRERLLLGFPQRGQLVL